MAFDGAQPVDRDLARRIFGDIDFDNLPVGSRRVLAAVVGGRGGKTYLLIALRLVFGMCVRDLSALAPGEEAFAGVVSLNDALRQQAVNYALGACRSKPELRALLRLPRNTKPEDSPSEFGLYRPDFDRVVTFYGAVATRGGYGVRGRWFTDLALDECAFFRDSTAKVNDKDIYEAGVSRVLPGGQVILGSTPWAKAGLLYEFFRDNYGKPDTCLVAHAPTLLLNDNPTTRQVVEMETRRDPENARREYQAQFMDSGTTVFFEETTLERATSDEAFELQPLDQVAAGADLGLRADSSALVLVARRGEMLHVFDGLECRPGEDAPLSLEATFAAFVAKLKANRCGYVMADQHYREAMHEALVKHDLAVASAQDTPADRYVRTRVLLRSGRVRIHGLEFRERLMKQLREVQGKPTTGGGMSIVHPRWATGGHGDIADALVLALWQLGGDVVQAPKPEMGTQEWETAAQEARRQQGLAERGRQKTDWRARMGLR